MGQKILFSIILISFMGCATKSNKREIAQTSEVCTPSTKSFKAGERLFVKTSHNLINHAAEQKIISAFKINPNRNMECALKTGMDPLTQIKMEPMTQLTIQKNYEMLGNTLQIVMKSESGRTWVFICDGVNSNLELQWVLDYFSKEKSQMGHVDTTCNQIKTVPANYESVEPQPESNGVEI